MRISSTNQRRSILAAACLLLAFVPAAGATPRSHASWASSEIARVTRVGVLGRSQSTFRPQWSLTEAALATAITRTDQILHPPVVATPATTTTTTTETVTVPAPAPPPAQVLSSIPDGATIAGTVDWQADVPAENLTQVAFAVDGTQIAVVTQAPFEVPGGFVTTALADGTHQLAVAATSSDGDVYVAAWNVNTANATPGAVLTALPSSPVSVPVTKRPPATPPGVTTTTTTVTTTVPAPPAPVAPQTPRSRLYVADDPSQPVTIEGLDAALVRYLGLDPAAVEFEQKLRAAGLEPKGDAGTEIVARLLDLRYTHPSNQVNLALLPFESATRAEAAYSFARVLGLDSGAAQWVQSEADSFELPTLTTWQRRILTTAVSYIGYPYVWGGTSPTAEAPFGVEAPGGFDCSGFAWRVFKLTSYPDERDLASVLRGRTTYVMSAEVPVSERIPASRLQPADALFFGDGPHSSPSQVDHMAIYLGNGWLIQSSDEGVTIAPFAGWYAHTFAWARRPLREAGLE
jgi:cell wall-associated NlpC family hydrolase